MGRKYTYKEIPLTDEDSQFMADNINIVYKIYHKDGFYKMGPDALSEVIVEVAYRLPHYRCNGTCSKATFMGKIARWKFLDIYRRENKKPKLKSLHENI